MKTKSLKTNEENNILDEIESMKSMMESCYTYGGIDKDSFNYKRYILQYQPLLGKRLFDKTYKEHSKHLKSFDIVPCVYTDSEGLSYNSLVKK